MKIHCGSILQELQKLSEVEIKVKDTIKKIACYPVGCSDTMSVDAQLENDSLGVTAKYVASGKIEMVQPKVSDMIPNEEQVRKTITN